MPKKSTKRKKHGGSGGSSRSKSSSRGVFSSMRSGMKNIAGTGGKKARKKKEVSFWDVLFWIAAALLGAAVIYRYFG